MLWCNFSRAVHELPRRISQYGFEFLLPDKGTEGSNRVCGISHAHRPPVGEPSAVSGPKLASYSSQIWMNNSFGSNPLSAACDLNRRFTATGIRTWSGSFSNTLSAERRMLPVRVGRD